MKLTFTGAQIITVLALIPAWIPSLMAWPVSSPEAIACWVSAFALMAFPLVYDYYVGLALR